MDEQLTRDKRRMLERAGVVAMTLADEGLDPVIQSIGTSSFEFRLRSIHIATDEIIRKLYRRWEDVIEVRVMPCPDGVSRVLVVVFGMEAMA